MKKGLTYQCCLVLLLVLTGLVSCNDGNKKELDKRITLFRADKIPYGTWYAYENLKHIFPDASIEANKKALSAYSSMSETADKLVLSGKKQALVIICRNMYPNDEESSAIHSFIQRGGNVFISAFNFNRQILDSLRLETATDFLSEKKGVTVNDPVTGKTDSFYYPGFPLEEYFSKIDTSITEILGRNANGWPNYVKFSWNGGGSLYLHSSPLALSNFFLLHKDNKKYYDEVFSHMASNTSELYWDDYFRNRRRNGDDDFSAMSWIRKQPPLATAISLLLLLALLVYLFESKRKQRAIPVRPPLKNATVEFARTVGRLYLQRKDNNNLAYKMAAIFMDHVRRKFNVRTTMDEEFIEKLSHKSGYDKAALSTLVYQLKYAQAHYGVTDMELLELQQQLDQFYRHT